jgi:hypothetical protein
MDCLRQARLGGFGRGEDTAWLCHTACGDGLYQGLASVIPRTIPAQPGFSAGFAAPKGDSQE